MHRKANKFRDFIWFTHHLSLVELVLRDTEKLQLAGVATELFVSHEARKLPLR